ncbi:hypothetical protein [Thaumasiovibrio subtropicus]|uniref:hypothetical protein n=1 Tax=Thaumasiovibrio subtropicus TaxID=1891207 RepID=UPI000B34B0CE|nr:hypothetical protein [Thaumasiovibrio subtropicus]
MNIEKTVCYQYLDTNLVINSESVSAVDKIGQFLSPYFESIQESNGSADFVINLYDGGYPGAIPWIEKGTPCFIRKSAKPFFTRPAFQFTHNGCHAVKSKKSGAIFLFYDNKVDIFRGTSDDAFMDVVELIRDTVFKQQKNDQVLILHSTVVSKAGQATLIIGKKGAGKSTLALDLVLNHGFQFVSGDKAFVTKDKGHLVVSGWPDYPHLGVGTFQGQPELANLLEFDVNQYADSQEKVAINPMRFKKVIPHGAQVHRLPICQLVFPQVACAAEGGEVRTQSCLDLLRENIEEPFGAKAQWNPSVIASAADVSDLLEGLDQINAVDVRGRSTSAYIGLLNGGECHHENA